MPTTAPRIAIGPDAPPSWTALVRRHGGRVVEDASDADAILWRGPDQVALKAALRSAPDLRWVQLGAAGVDAWAATDSFGDGRIWTSAKGAYAAPVAEHALALVLALLRELPTHVRASQWGPQTGRSLYGSTVTVLGGSGGIGRALAGLLRCCGASVRTPRRVPDTGTDRAAARAALLEDLAVADAVVIAAALTPSSRGLIGRDEFAVMSQGAVLVNVGRGALVDTDALLHALDSGQLGGAGLDVTDPEPLPDGHPLWSHPGCLITPHTANTAAMLQPLLERRFADNLERFAAGRELLGVIDPVRGY